MDMIARFVAIIFFSAANYHAFFKNDIPHSLAIAFFALIVMAALLFIQTHVFGEKREPLYRRNSEEQAVLCRNFAQKQVLDSVAYILLGLVWFGRWMPWMYSQNEASSYWYHPLNILIILPGIFLIAAVLMMVFARQIINFTDKKAVR